MTDELRSQPASDDIGHAWLGTFPAHWKRTTIGAIATRRSDRNRTDLPLLSVLREKGVVPRSTLGEDENHNVIPEDLSNYRVALTGDLVVNKMKAWQGSVGIAPCDGVVSPAYFVFQLSGISRPFAHRLFRSKPYVAFFGHASDGVRIGQWDLSIDRMKRIPVPLPPPEEQDAIVRFLAALDRRVNRFVRAKRRLIELLTEQKQAIITHAVTRGLNPNARRKPSGIDWLGDVPEHWEVRAVWQLFSIGRGEVTSNQYVGDHPGPYPLYSSQTENNGVMGNIDTYMFEGDYLTWTTDGAHAGTVFHRTGRFNCTNVCGTLKAKATEQLDLPFMRWALGAVTKRQVRLDINPKLMNNMMARIRVCLPPAPEQSAIGVYLASVVATNDVVIQRLEREIALVREYRTRLVSDVVTGKLDVRAAAVTLPDEAAEPIEAIADDEPDTDAEPGDEEPAAEGVEEVEV